MSRTYGYARVSTTKQNIERQIRNIKAEAPDAIVITDEYTGTKLSRPGWMKLYDRIESGDTIIFDSVSRMSRDAYEGFLLYEDLFQKGVNLIFLKERHIDTQTYKSVIDGKIQLSVTTGSAPTDELIGGLQEVLNRYFLSLAKEQIRLAFEQAEKEVQDLHQRTREGIETARLEGKQIGQKKGAKLTVKKALEMKPMIRKYSKDFDGSLSDADVMKLTGLARNTYYKYKKELKEE